jgi:riboflavin biosynthesis pyrimidine reductase
MLEGSNSFVLASAPSLDLAPPRDPTGLFEDFLPGEMIDAASKWFVVLDSRGRVRWTMKQNRDWHLMVAVSSSTPAGYLAFLREERIPYLVAGEERIGLELLLRLLAERLAVRTVIGDGGGILNGVLLRAGLVDEVDIQFVPGIIGSRSAPSLFDGFDLGEDGWPKKLRMISVEDRGEGFFFLRYAVD